MKRYILTGAPGSGKTSIINALRIKGINIVSEAATDIINYKQTQGTIEPWKNPNFIDDIIKLQKQRQIALLSNTIDTQFYDRSPICTYALALYLRLDISDNLANEISRINKYNIYQREVFFIDNLGFIKNTNARKINFQDSLKFEQIHIEAYSKFDYKCIHIPALPIEERAKLILNHINFTIEKNILSHQ